ncbi:MAG: hypothetical protein EHM20_01520 [Alphaproteobacteria bacterium]|nr:MAG: hypothetical protein EHM20_01520 [Alphaproteobacteria bacterium]
MNRKEKISLLKDIATGAVKLRDVKHKFIPTVLFDADAGILEDHKGVRYTKEDLEKCEHTVLILPMIKNTDGSKTWTRK